MSDAGKRLAGELSAAFFHEDGRPVMANEGMDLLAHWDASNSVRLCDRCEDEYGVSAGADKGDRACACCGNHEAPHVYPAIDRGAVDRVYSLIDDLEAELNDVTHWGAGYQQALDDLREHLPRHFGESS